LPLSTTFTPAGTGSGVRTYIIDTGVYASNDFSSRLVTGYDFVDNDTNATDCQGHGTHVAGTVAGTTYGVAKSATVVPVRVLDCSGSGYTSDVIAGINWAITDHLNNPSAPAVANMSLGGGANKSMDDAVAAAVAAGITMVVAAGNSNADACTASPAREVTAITVGATDSADARASFSNYGTCVDIFAPGVAITSDWISSPTSTNTLNGTSMAAPHAAGAAARLLAGRHVSCCRLCRRPWCAADVV
jgi:serine protease